MARLHFEITTPERTVYKEDIDQVTVPTASGEITILPNHTPLVSQLASGELVVKHGDDITLTDFAHLSMHLADLGAFHEFAHRETPEGHNDTRIDGFNLSFKIQVTRR